MTFDLSKLTKYMEIVDATAKLSKDPSTKVGALILGPAFEVRSIGYNGAPVGVRQMRTIEIKDPKSSSGSATPNSTQSPTPQGWAHLSMAALCLLLTLLAWIAHERLSRLESCVSSPATQAQTFLSDGSSTPDAPRHSSKSAKLIM